MGGGASKNVPAGKKTRKRGSARCSRSDPATAEYPADKTAPGGAFDPAKAPLDNSQEDHYIASDDAYGSGGGVTGRGVSGVAPAPAAPTVTANPPDGTNGSGEEESDHDGENRVANLHDALAAAAQHLRARQRDRSVNLSKNEMEDLMLLTREMESLKQMMKRSQFSIQGTWALIEKEGMLERFAQQLYDELLTRNPRLRVYFYGVDLDEQSRTLVRMLGTAVRFYDRPQVTVDMFTKAGARHRGYGITDDVLIEMQHAFFTVFPKFVGVDAFTAAEEEWRKFWKIVLDLLQHGSHSTEGEQYGKMHEEKTINKLQSDFQIIAERQDALDSRQQLVGLMYSKAVEMYGDLSQFEGIRGPESSKLIFQAFFDIVANLHDKEKCTKFIRELGARHINYHVTEDNIHSFAEPFVFACQNFLQEEWNVAMEARFEWLFEFIAERMCEGIAEARKSSQQAPQRSPTRQQATICLIFTDIEASTKLWQRNPQAMSAAVKRHHRIIRSLIVEYGAYEVKTVGDSFMIAAKDMLVGTKLTLGLQLELMRNTPIAPGFEMVENTEGRGDPNTWDKQTLRVRIGMEHSTEVAVTYDTVHRRYDYSGPSVNRCARIEAAACGGQILMSRESFEVLKSIPEFHDEVCPKELQGADFSNFPEKLEGKGLDHFVSVSDVGLASLKGISKPVHLVSMVPQCFAGRLFVDKVARISKRSS